MIKILQWIVTLGPIGYLPAPGTMGTIATLPLAYVLSFLPFAYQLIALAALSCAAYFVICRALPNFAGATDPSQIIIDEVIGTLVTFVGFRYHPLVWICGFLLFRLFDIFKPCGIRKLEKIPGGFGILIDDVVAGLWAHSILRLLFL